MTAHADAIALAGGRAYAGGMKVNPDGRGSARIDRRGRGRWRLPPEAALAAVSGVVTIAALGVALEPAAGRLDRLADSPWVGVALASSAAAGLSIASGGMGRALGRGRRRAGLTAAGLGAAAALGAAGALSGASLALAAGGVFLIGVHHVVGRYVPAVGAAVAATLTGVVLLMANPPMTYVWPVLLAMTHVLACRLVSWGLGTRRPRLSVRGTIAAATVVALWSLALVSITTARRVGIEAPEAALPLRRWAWLGPAIAAGVMLAAGVIHVGRRGGSDGRRPRTRAAGEAARAWHWRGLMLYDLGWLAAIASPAAAGPAALLAASLLTAWTASRPANAAPLAR